MASNISSGKRGKNANTKKEINSKKTSHAIEAEILLLRNFEYNSETQITDSTDVADVSVTLVSLFEQLKQKSNRFQLHVKSFPKRKKITRCVTIAEYLKDYLIDDNELRFKCSDNYPTIYNWLTSFSGRLTYDQNDRVNGEDKDCSSEEEDSS